MKNFLKKSLSVRSVAIASAAAIMVAGIAQAAVTISATGMASPNATSSDSGAVSLESGTTTTSGNSGALTIASGAAAINSGALAIASGSSAGGLSGDVSVDVGAAGSLSADGTLSLGDVRAYHVNIGTNPVVPGNIIAIGASGSTFSLASSGLNVDSAGALTGVGSLDTITSSSTALTFAAAGQIESGTGGAFIAGSGDGGGGSSGNATFASGQSLSLSSGNVTIASGYSQALDSGAVSISSGISAARNSGNITIASGNSTANNSGSVSIDAGTAISTVGTVSVGGTNAKAITLGNAGSTTTVHGTAAMASGSFLSLDRAPAGTATANAITMNAQSGVITSSTNNLGGNAGETITLTDSKITANSVVIAVINDPGTGGLVVVTNVTPSAGWAAFHVDNFSSSPMSTTYSFSFAVFN